MWFYWLTDLIINTYQRFTGITTFWQNRFVWFLLTCWINWALVISPPELTEPDMTEQNPKNGRINEKNTKTASSWDETDPKDFRCCHQFQLNMKLLQISTEKWLICRLENVKCRTSCLHHFFFYGVLQETLAVRASLRALLPPSGHIQAHPSFSGFNSELEAGVSSDSSSHRSKAFRAGSGKIST